MRMLSCKRWPQGVSSEQYHSLGSMSMTEEVTLPGFRLDVHAFGYQLASLSPVPTELNLDKHGFELLKPEISYSHVFPDRGYISMYRSVDKTAMSIERYSKKDARTWKKPFCLVITFGTLYSKHFASKIKMLFFIPRYLPLFSTISAFYHLPQSFRSFRIIIKSWLCATRWAYSPAVRMEMNPDNDNRNCYIKRNYRQCK